MNDNSSDELEQFKRDINFVEYAASLGYEIDKRESSRSSIIMRGPDNNDKIIVATAQDGHFIYFSVRDDADNGSIIDFVQRRKGLNLGQVRRELRRWIGERADLAPVRITKPKATHANRPRIQCWYMRMAPQPVGGHPYLRSRGLSSETLTDSRFEPMIRIDHRGNAIFPHYDRDGLSGYEIKNQGFTGFSAGGEKRLWYSTNLAHAPRVVVVESAIDAMSHAQIINGDAEAAYISIGGQMSAVQRDLLLSALRRADQRGAEIIIATDADAAGDRLADEIGGMLPSARRDRPGEGKDWNDIVNRFRKPSQPGTTHKQV